MTRALHRALTGGGKNTQFLRPLIEPVGETGAITRRKTVPDDIAEPAVAAAIRTPDRSVAMLSRVEMLISCSEERFGKGRLLRTVSAIDECDRLTHVDFYRVFIRTNTWPNSMRPSGMGEFYDEYERSAVQYVKVGFEALAWLAGEADYDLNEIYRRVTASEALRGQFGKRSPTGLDERLEEIVTQLEERIGGLGLSDVDSALTLLGTPGVDIPTAETLLLRDLRELQLAFPEPPSAAQLAVGTGPANDLAWGFLRRHCRWSVEHLQRAYLQYDDAGLSDMIAAADAFRLGQENERFALLADIRARTTDAEFADLCGVARDAITLNHMNLTLEPSYSFKGGPGLAHGMIIRAAQKADGIAAMTKEEIRTAKWRLLRELG